MIPSDAVDEYLSRELDSHLWMKELSERDVDAALARLSPRPWIWPGDAQNPGGTRLHQKVSVLLGIAHPGFGFWIDMGGGKTLVALTLLRYWWDMGALRRALIFVTSDKAFLTWEKQIRRFGVGIPYMALEGSSEQKWRALDEFGEGLVLLTRPGAVAMVSDKVVVRQKGKKPRPHLRLTDKKVAALARWAGGIVWDECFPAGTLVSTPSGDRVIESLEPGDVVCGSFGPRRVRRLLAKNSSAMVRLVLSDGSELKCTPNHPFFTEVGWVCAGNAVGRSLFDKESLRRLWGSAGSFPEKVLQFTLLSELAEAKRPQCGDSGEDKSDDEGSSTPSGMAEEHRRCTAGSTSSVGSGPYTVEQGRSDAGGVAQEAVEDLEGHGPWHPPAFTGREWSTLVAATADAARCIRLAVETRAFHFIGEEAAQLSNALQSGLGERSREDRDRGRRERAPLSAPAGFGREEGFEAALPRVESVEDIELDGPVPVYSLEVEGCPHFFAGGVLVHNSTREGNQGSLQWKLADRLRRHAHCRYALAGRPFGRDPTMLFPQYKLIDGGETLGETLGLFRAVFCSESENRWDPRGRAKDYVFRNEMRGELSRMVQHRSITYTADECIDLPAVVPIVEEVSFPTEAQSYYDRVVKDLIRAKGNYRAAKNVFLRMRQVSSGFVGVHDDETGARAEIEFSENPKLERLLDLLVDLPDMAKAVVFYEFTWSGRKISGALREAGDQPAWLWAGTKDPRAELRRFLGDPRCRTAIVQNRVGAYSLDGLQDVAWYTFFYESPVSPIDREQAERRLERDGQRHRVCRYDLVVRGSADQKILDFHAEGDDLMEAVVRDPARLVR